MDFDVKVKVQTTGKEQLEALEDKIKSLKTNTVKIDVEVDNKQLENLFKDLSKDGNGPKIKPEIDKSSFDKFVKKARSRITSEKIQFKIDTGQTISDLAKIEAKISKLNGSKYLDDANFKKAFSTLKSFQDIKLDTNNIDSYNKALKTCQNYLQAASAEQSTFASSSQRLTLLDKAQKQLLKNSAYTKEAKAQIQSYINEINHLGDSMSKLDYTRISNGLKETDIEMQSIGRTGKSFTQWVGGGIKQMGQFALLLGGIYSIPVALKKITDAVLEVDTAMTELRKVSDADDSQLSSYFEHASISAKKYGAEINDVISSAADWKRLGYSFEESGELADVTTLLQRVGDNMTQESSASGLISTLKGFGKDADEALSIVDKINEVANTKPIDTSGLFAGLERSASSMSAANNTLEETISLITAANSVVQDPDVVGTSFKTISMRIRAAKTELEEAGLETDGMAESTAKLREEIMALSGVDIMQDEDTFKSTYDILDELSKKWQNLTDIKRASITELIAGKRQGNVMSALMSNFDIARETLNTAMNESEGSAERELGKYQESIQYSIDALKAQFQELSNIALDSDFLKGTLDTGTALLDLFTKIVDTVGVLPVLLGGVGITSFFKNLDLLKTMDLGKGFSKIENKIGDIGLSFKNIFGILKAHPLAMGFTAITAGITAIHSAWEKYKENLISSATESTNAWNESYSSLNELTTRYATLKTKLDSGDLSSSEDYQIRQQILDIQSQITAQYGEQSSGINLVNGNLETQLSLLNNISSQNAKSIINKDFREYDDAKKEMQDKRKYRFAQISSDFNTFDTDSASDFEKELGKIVDKYNELKFVKTDFGSEILFEGDASTADKVINDFINDIDKISNLDKDYADRIIYSASDTLKENNEILKNYRDNYKSYLQMDMISEGTVNGSISDIFDKYAESVQNYNNALASGDDTKIRSARLEYEKLSETSNTLLKQGNNSRFQTLFDDVANQLDKSSIKVNDFFDAINGKATDKNQFSKVSDDVEQAASALKEFELDAQEVRNALLTSGNQTGESYIKTLADAWGVDTKSTDDVLAFIDALIQAGIVSGNVVDDIDSVSNSFEQFKTNVATAIESLDVINAALANSFSGKGLSLEIDKETGLITGEVAAIQEAFQHLPGYDPSILFEKTANGIHLNRRALRELQAQVESTQKAENSEKILSLQEQINEELQKQSKLNENSGEYAQSQAIIDNLQSQLEIAKQISSAYDGATSAYQKWLNAQSNGEEGDMYRSVSETMLERGEQLYQEGRYNTEEFRAIADYFSNEDLLNAPMEKIVSEYEKAKPIMDSFFTGGKEGLDNFAAAMKKMSDEENLGWVEELEDGKIKFNTGSDEEIAERFGLSKESIQALFRAMSEYSDDYQIGDSLSTEELNKKLEESAQKAEEAKENLKKLQDEGQISSDIKLDIDVSELDEAGIDDRIASLEKLKEEAEIKFGADSSEVEYVNRLLDEAKLRKQQLEQQSSVGVSVDINSECDLDILREKLNSLPEDEVSNVSININNESQLDNVVQEIEQMPSDKQVALSFTVSNQDQADSLKSKLDQLSSESGKSINYEINIKDNTGNALDKNVKDETKTVTVNEVQGTKIEIKDETKTVTVNEVQGTTVNSNDQVANVSYKASAQTPPEDKNAKVNYKKGKQDKPSDKSAKVNYKLGSQANPVSPKTATVNYKLGTVAKPSDVTVKVNYDTSGKPKGKDGPGGVNGTAHANGTFSSLYSGYKAYAFGTPKNITLNKNQSSLVNEIGMESVVRDGKWMLIPGGAHIEQFKKGDIIFNSKQTADLIEHGYITGGNKHGKMAMVDGTAYNMINAYSSGSWSFGNTGNGNLNSGGKYSSPKPKSSNNSPKKSSNTTSDQKAANEFKETIDYIEMAIDRIERQIKNIERIAGSAYNTFSKRNTALKDQISSITDELSIQEAGYNRYIQEANSVSLSEDYKNQIRNGSIDISTITDKDLAENIKNFKQWYEKALDCKDAIEELKESVRDLYKEAFDNVVALYDGIIAQIEHRQNILEGYINQTETQGYIVSSKYYDALIANEKGNLEQLTKQRQELIDAMNDAIVNGNIEMYSEQWYEFQESINSVNESIQESNTKLIEFRNAIRELEWDIFDKLQERISGITDEADFLLDLMSNDDMYDEKGKVTEKGTASYGLHGVNYNVYMSQADQYREEMEKIQKELSKDPYNETLIERRKELLELQRKSILSAEKEKQAIKDLVEDGIKKQLDALDELIDKYLDAMDSQKDMYDYQKKVDNQQKEVNSLEKQLIAYAGDDSEEGNAKRQQLQNDLKEAKDNLEETQYDKYISEQKRLLNELYTEYETVLNMRLDNIDQLITDVISNINLEADGIRETLISEAESVGYKLTDSMNTIWGSNGTISNILTTYSNNFSNTMTTVQAAINDIKTSIKNAIAASNKSATANIEKSKNDQKQQTATPTKPKSPPTTSNKNNNTSGGDGIPRIGDKVTFVSGKYYYDSYGSSPTGSQNLGGTVYITYMNTRPGATKPYGISRTPTPGEDDLGWVSLDQIKGYKTGTKRIDKEQLAWTDEGKNGISEPEMIVRKSDGAILTRMKPEDAVIPHNFTNNLFAWGAIDPNDFMNENKAIASSLSNLLSYNRNPINNIQNEFNINIAIDKVQDYNDFISKLQIDKKFEKIIQAMTLDQIAGKNGLSKHMIQLY